MTEYPEASRDAFPVTQRLPTRWRDNDAYGHMNNVVYYEYFDTAVNRWLIESGALAVPNGPVIGLVAETSCRYFAALGFPDILEVGISTLRVGRSSVVYGMGLFREDEAEAAALCRYVHVYVDADSRRPTALPERMQNALSDLSASNRSS